MLFGQTNEITAMPIANMTRLDVRVVFMLDPFPFGAGRISVDCACLGARFADIEAKLRPISSLFCKRRVSNHEAQCQPW